VIRTAHAFFPPRWIVRARDVNTARRELAAVVREIDPTQPFIEIQSLDAMLLNSVGMQRFYLIVLSAFALFAVLLAAVGIYAAYSYAMASRTAEIGVRLALGASPGAIVRSIMWRALMRGAIAIAVGLAGAAATTRVLDSVLFNIRSSDPWTYVAVAVVLLGAVGLATLIPAARAVKMDPLVALRR
jgi:putative ABC transport system permease protein